MNLHVDLYAGLAPSSAQVRAALHAQNRQHYLRDAPMAELAALTGALAGEFSARGIQVAPEMSVVQARVEYHVEREADAAAMVAQCVELQQGEGGREGG